MREGKFLEIEDVSIRVGIFVNGGVGVIYSGMKILKKWINIYYEW